MRAAWNLRSGLLEYFTPAQAETIQRRLASRRDNHAAAQQDVNAAPRHRAPAPALMLEVSANAPPFYLAGAEYISATRKLRYTTTPCTC